MTSQNRPSSMPGRKSEKIYAKQGREQATHGHPALQGPILPMPQKNEVMRGVCAGGDSRPLRGGPGENTNKKMVGGIAAEAMQTPKLLLRRQL